MVRAIAFRLRATLECETTVHRGSPHQIRCMLPHRAAAHQVQSSELAHLALHRAFTDARPALQFPVAGSCSPAIGEHLEGLRADPGREDIGKAGP